MIGGHFEITPSGTRVKIVVHVCTKTHLLILMIRKQVSMQSVILTLLSSSVTDHLHGQGTKGKMVRSVTKAILRNGSGDISSFQVIHLLLS